MARRGLLLLLLLLSALQPLWPSALPPPGTAAGKAAVAGLILSALERATVFLEKRLPEINLDGVVGFRVLAVMFCGLAGFSDFYKRRWLEAIVSWQRPQEGCFGKPAATGEAAPRAPQSPRRLLRRVKRQEKEFTDGCLAHQTTTAVAALGGFLYILAEDPGEDGAPPPRAAPEPTVHR